VMQMVAGKMPSAAHTGVFARAARHLGAGIIVRISGAGH
jgi:hypothetical protein